MLETPMYPPVLALQEGSDNLRGADNQQERLSKRHVVSFDVKRVPRDIGHYLAGFADGEGSFNLSFRKRKDYKMPWKISLCFNVSQKDKVILALYKRHMACGTLRQREDGIWYYEVNNFNAIVENVIPFFNEFRFLSAKKKRDFSKFKEMARMIRSGEHLNENGVKRILEIRKTMNDGGVGRRKYSDEEILNGLSSRESSETTRQAHVR